MEIPTIHVLWCEMLVSGRVYLCHSPGIVVQRHRGLSKIQVHVSTKIPAENHPQIRNEAMDLLGQMGFALEPLGRREVLGQQEKQQREW